MRNKSLIKSKTFWTGVATVVTTAAGFFTGTIALAPAIQTAATALIGIFLRDALRDEVKTK
jgi:hypothetical protein